MARKNSTYARLLKPGDRFYVKGDYRTYTVKSVEIQMHRDSTPIVLEGKRFEPSGDLMTLVRIHVKERSTALVFDGIDRVEFTND